MATDDERSGGWYTHTDADEANLLKAKIKSAICSHKNEDDMYEAYEGSIPLISSLARRLQISRPA